MARISIAEKNAAPTPMPVVVDDLRLGKLLGLLLSVLLGTLVIPDKSANVLNSIESIILPFSLIPPIVKILSPSKTAAAKSSCTAFMVVPSN